MSADGQVISFLSPGELIALMRATSGISVGESTVIDGQPVIHASLKLVNARTGQDVPGGLPFSVVLFKAAQEQGYSNIAIGTVVPVAELDVTLPRDYFNLCNQRFRFTRAFPISPGAFVLQMDLMLRHATREYVKFAFGLWGTLFSHILFELVGRGRESLVAAAEAYALAHTDFAQHVVAPDVLPAGEEAAPEVFLEPPAEQQVEVAAEAAPVAKDELVLVRVSEDGVSHEASALLEEPVAAEEAPQAIEPAAQTAVEEEIARAVEPVSDETETVGAAAGEAVVETVEAEQPAVEDIAPQADTAADAPGVTEDVTAEPSAEAREVTA